MNAGIDPGKWKIGAALAENGVLLFSAIVPEDNKEILFSAFKSGDWSLLAPYRQEGSAEAAAGKRPDSIFIGSGTSSSEFRALFPLPHINADEYGTTLEARQIYWRLHRPCGIMKLVPTSLRTPPRNVDDLAAFAILTRAEKNLMPSSQ